MLRAPAILAVVILALPMASGHQVVIEDPADDQYLAPGFKAFDIEALELNGSAEAEGGFGAGLVWGIGFHRDMTAQARPHPDFDNVVVHGRLGGNDTEDPYRQMCLSSPPACFGGTLTHASFGPDMCVFEDVFVALWYEGDRIDRVPDAGNLTYDACWVFTEGEAPDDAEGTAPADDGANGTATQSPGPETSSGPDRGESASSPLWLALVATIVAFTGPWSGRRPGR